MTAYFEMQNGHDCSRAFFLKSTVITWSMFVIFDAVITRCSFLAVGRLFRIIFVDRKTTSKPIAPHISMAMTVSLLAQLN